MNEDTINLSSQSSETECKPSSGVIRINAPEPESILDETISESYAPHSFRNANLPLPQTPRYGGHKEHKNEVHTPQRINNSSSQKCVFKKESSTNNRPRLHSDRLFRLKPNGIYGVVKEYYD